MKIAALNNIIYQNKIEKQKQTYFRNENVTDVFVKMPVSFCGEAQSNEETIDSILHQLVYFSKKHLKDFPRLAKVYGIPDLCQTVCKVMDKDYMKDTIVDILRQAGITSFKSLEMFIREVSKPKVAENMHDDYIGLVDVYAQLEHKSCLSKYPEILFYIYRSEQESSSPDFSRINRVANFMYETCNAQDTTDFYMGCRFLMPKFGDFNSGFDFIEAVEYLIDTYPQKIELLKDVIHKNKDLKCTPQELYLKAGPIIDYLYELNNGESIGEFSEIAPLVLKLKDIKRYPTECLEYFNASDDFIEQIEFCKLLAKSNVSINEFNQFCKTSILDNTSIIALIKNKNAALEKLDFIGNIKPHEASKLYQDFAQIFALAKQDDETSEIEAYKTIASMVQKYGIKNSDSFCSFYSKHMGVNKKTYSPNEIKEFIELNRFSRSINVIDISRKTKTPVKDILFEQKVLFEAVEPVITKYLADTKSSFYIGLDAFDIFEKYRNLIQENINNIPALLDALIETEGDTQEYKNRREKLNLFSSYFSSDEELKEFFAQNQINFDTDEKSERYLQACLAVVKALYNKDDLEFSKQKLTHLSDSGILKNSKSSLADFVESTEEDTLIKIINKLAEKEIFSMLFNKNAIFQAEVITLSRLAYRILNEVGGNNNVQLSNLSATLFCIALKSLQYLPLFVKASVIINGISSSSK